MSKGLKVITQADVRQALEEELVPQLSKLMSQRENGHCMRVSYLETALMKNLVHRLRKQRPDAEVYILCASAEDGPYGVTSTKLVELRNPLGDGSLRGPLLVFVPDELRTSSEDSFGVATFEDVALGGVFAELRRKYIDALPVELRSSINEIVSATQQLGWDWARDLALLRYLLTVRINQNDAEVAGAALYELGLVPDFQLLNHPSSISSRIRANIRAMQALTTEPRTPLGRVLLVGLKDRAFRAELGEYLNDQDLDYPSWTRNIAIDRSAWKFSFHHWKFEDEQQLASICIFDVQVDLPVVDANGATGPLVDLEGQKYLAVGAGGQKSFKVTCKTEPAGNKVDGLEKFVLQVCQVAGGPIGLSRTKKPSANASTALSVSFTSLNKVEWEEGWYYLRVLAQTNTGDLIPLVDPDGQPIAWIDNTESGESGTSPNKSDLFYVLPNDDVDVEPPQRSLPKELSVAHALLRLQFQALAGGNDPCSVSIQRIDWAEKKRGAPSIEVGFGKHGTFQVPMNPVLLDLERKVLAAPDHLGTWEVNLSLGGTLTPSRREPVTASTIDATEFLESRKRLFETVRGGDREGVIQAWVPGRELVCQYAGAYLALLHEVRRQISAPGGDRVASLKQDLQKLLALDSLAISIVSPSGVRRECVLMGPTHPLRLLWWAAWFETGTTWLERSDRAGKDLLAAARDTLAKSLTPRDLPMYVPGSKGRSFSCFDDLHPYWSVYTHPDSPDPRSLVGEVSEALGVAATQASASGGIDPGYLAGKLSRYLVQHPYVTTLVINAFNCGRGEMLAGTLVELQRVASFKDIDFEIRQFTSGGASPHDGEALRELMRPEGPLFSQRSGSTKLRFAVMPQSEFVENPRAFQAHIAFLFDVFPPEEVGVEEPEASRICPLHGLLTTFARTYSETDGYVEWKRAPEYGTVLPINDSEDLTGLLEELPRAMAENIGSLAAGDFSRSLTPHIRLDLDSQAKALIHKVHTVSDWVVTVDRNFGVEFFDRPRSEDRPEYLVDHSPNLDVTSGHRVIITSRSLDEIEGVITSGLRNQSIAVTKAKSQRLLDELRFLSGRVSLKLLSSPSQRLEAIGLGLARLYLGKIGALAPQILVPLDDHLDLYTDIVKGGDAIGEEVSLQRTDLALLDLNAAKKHITCRLMEVKCYTKVDSIASLEELKNKVASQLDQSMNVLRWHFDPAHQLPDRVDRQFKSAQLEAILRGYLERSLRLEALGQGAYEEAKYLLQHLAEGYSFSVQRAALVFDFSFKGADDPDLIGDLQFYRIGKDIIQALLDESVLEVDERPSESSVPVPRNTERFVPIHRKRDERPETTSAHIEAIPTRPSEPAEYEPEAAVSEAEPVVAAVAEEAGAEPDILPVKSDEGFEDERASATPRVDLPRGGASLELLGPGHDVILGVNDTSPQYGIIGETSGRKVAIDLNQTHTISLFGVQGGGKSYTLGSVVEMASMPIPAINQLPSPLATVIFHYSPTQDYRPEFTSMRRANDDAGQLKILKERYGAEPQSLDDVVLLAPEDKLDERRREFPGIEVYPLQFSANELSVSHWKFLMGAVGSQALYIRQLNRIIKGLRGDVTIDALRQGIQNSRLSDNLKDLADERLNLAADYISDTSAITSLVRPGRLIIVDLRDELIEKDEALGLFVVLLQLFAEAKIDGKPFNKLVVFDEAHKYIDSPDLVAGLVEVVREMRHKGTSIMVASQDPPSVPIALIELSSQVILHRFNSPGWLKHIQKANAALSSLTPEKMATLGSGEAYIWSSKASDGGFCESAIKVKCRPRVTKHGGDTRTAV